MKIKLIIDFLNDNNGIATIIAAFSAFVLSFSVIVAFCFNQRTQNQYKKSQEPQLSMWLDKRDSILYLVIRNEGKTAAKDVKIEILSIEGNDDNKLFQDKTPNSFSLYPNESTFIEVAYSVETILTGKLFPTIEMKISYIPYTNKKPIKYSRFVSLYKIPDKDVTTKVDLNLNGVESNLKSIARGNTRIANYLDGRQVAAFDELNILADRSLHNDLCSVIEKSKTIDILDRIATIEECLKIKIVEKEETVDS